MDPFCYIWNAATFKRSSCGSNIAVIVGLIFMMIFGAYAETREMMLCSRNESMPCVLSYGETRKVCPGDSVYTNITLIVGPNIIPQNVYILWHGIQFSKGPVVSGPFHNGDEHIDRWTNKISFQGNTMTYELWNSEINFNDDFICQVEIDIGGERFISEDIKWFDVHRRNCIAKSPSIKDTTEQYIDNITKQLDQLMVQLINSSASDMAERKKINIQYKDLFSQLANQLSEMHEGLEDVKSKLDTQNSRLDTQNSRLDTQNSRLDTQNSRLDTSNKMDIAQIVVLVLVLIISAKTFIPLSVQKDLQDKFSGLLNRIGCNKLPSSTTSDHSSVPPQSSASRNQDEPSSQITSNNSQASNTGEGSTPSDLIDLHSAASPQSTCMPSPEDELHYEEEATDV